MAVQSVKKGFDTASQDENGKRVEVPYLVLLEQGDSAVLALSASAGGDSVPAALSTHPDDSLLKLTSKTTERVGGESGLLIKVVCVYTPSNREQRTGGKWNKRVRVSGIENVEQVNRDANKKPIVNSFPDVYPASVEKVWYDEEINVSFDSDDIDVIALGDSRGRINSGAVTLNITRGNITYTRTFPAKTLKLGNASYEIAFDPDAEAYWAVTIPLYYRTLKNQSGTEVGWTRLIVDKGIRYKDGSGNTVTPKDGMEVFLDGTGKKLADGADAILLPFDIEESVDFMTFLAGV